MIIKVCGIKYQGNLNEIAGLPIDMVGFNFYPASKRFLESPLSKPESKDSVEYVGVFVNESVEEILNIVKLYQLDYIQLHGDESSEMVNEIAEKVKVIKAFSISDKDDFRRLETFDAASYFLFDTKTPEYGGSGNKWKWDLLNHYHYEIPFLLAGGIGLEDWNLIQEINHPQFAGVDINSRFEIEPGRKDIEKVTAFARKCREIYSINQKTKI